MVVCGIAVGRFRQEQQNSLTKDKATAQVSESTITERPCMTGRWLRFK